jgi:predicted nuclease of predicted toxin-antitoxin system
MKFCADENVARAIVIWLRDNGHDVLYASEAKPGSADSDWLDEAQKAGRMILTSDKDFGELIFRDRLNSHGVILLRMEHLTVKARIARLQLVWSVIEANPVGKFIVVTEKRVRVRSLDAEEEGGE